MSTFNRTETDLHPPESRTRDTVIRRASRVLNPDRPTMALAALARCPRSTARSWATGHRRPPITILQALREAIKERQSALLALIPELDHVIMKREHEPKHSTGFCAVNPLTGQDRRNRLGDRSARGNGEGLGLVGLGRIFLGLLRS